MPCSLCGDVCRCASGESSAGLPCVPADGEVRLSLDSGNEDSKAEENTAWREELANRLNRYQARRKPRPPRYPSLRLKFEDTFPRRVEGEIHDEPANFMAGGAIISSGALARDPFEVREATSEESREIPAGERQSDFKERTGAAAPATGKILEFPRSWTPPVAPLNELAEPVMERPRILEAPEVVPPPPALGGITIEPALQPAAEKRRGIDIPRQTASLARRISSTLIDGLIVGTACVLFGIIFWKMTGIRPARLQISEICAGLFGAFWAAYQYLQLVYSGTTAGLRLGGVELAGFDGNPASRSRRRWRVFASFLSAISLGMGYAWALLDEDSLCWHDRITHTCLARRQGGV